MPLGTLRRNMPQTLVLNLTSEPTDAEKIRQAAFIVRSGGLVAFPTETVYGLAANADDTSAIARLRSVKARPVEKPFSIHLADREQVLEHTAPLNMVARKALERLLPGPVTLVLPDRKGGFVGIRVPAHDVARQFLREAAVPVVAPSANRADQPAPVDAAGVLAELDGQIDAVLDAGPTPMREASAVVQLGRGPIQMLRSGLITEADIRRIAHVMVLFVCTGNSCRSPMAEGLLRKRLADAHGVEPSQLPECGYEILSAGTACSWSVGATPQAIEVLRRFGIDLSTHRARPATPELLNRADRIFAMTRSHIKALLEIEPAAQEKLELLCRSGEEIPDPVGGGLEVFRRCAEQIDRAIAERMEEL